ncbi:glycoside hydrolase domain-containing protein [Dyadobacter bucti]|uniref:glycoside hydrolase domain-containing protein n=1 Tax=Dyadobacter bucti TaxID=2572203 RepID=UPI003F70CDBF
MKRALYLSLFCLQLFIQAHAQELKYAAGQNQWNGDSLGNHRAVVQVEQAAGAAKATIDWRRRDHHTDSEIIVVDGQTTQRILNVKAENISRESGDIFFEPVSGPGKYYIYYLPYKVNGRSNYPTATYLKRTETATEVWKQNIASKSVAARVTMLESVNAINSFYPMEVIAKASEVSQLAAAHASKRYLVFPEDRMHPIKMTDDLPQRWILTGAATDFKAEVSPGENFSFQLGIYPLKADLKNITVRFNDLKNGNNSIPANAFSCLNTEGTAWDGKPLKNTVNVAKGKVQALWCLSDIPSDIPAGIYTGTVRISADNEPQYDVQLTFTVGAEKLHDKGISSPEKQTRLAWLNSTMAQDNQVISPYIPLKRNGNSIDLLGRKLIISENGLPAGIQTFFTPEMTGISKTPKNIIQAPVNFQITDATGNAEKLVAKSLKYDVETPGTVGWSATSSSQNISLDIKAHIEFDGFVAYEMKVTALQDIALSDIFMDIPMNRDAAGYMMGLNLKGGKRPATYDWKWEVATKNQDGAWIGDVNAGLNFSLRDEKYVRPLNTNFYLQKPLLLPASWGNDNKGGIRISEKGDQVLVSNYSGARTMKKGESLYYNFTLLITPFHALDTDFQWKTRFYHKYNNPDSIKATGATIVNIHHATPINPYVNYPFIEHKAMKEYIDKAHQDGLQVKIYNTIRELSNSAYELAPLRSLGHEIFSPGKGLGYAWLQEHLGDDYIAAWYVPELKDAAVVNSGMSRWHNYYVEGMNWLTQKVGIDGIYLDDVAFDRTTMKRVKRVLTQNNHPGIIDLHSANQYNKNDGFNNSANLYMEHFPYLNRLWFGEYFDYEKNSPDFFLTEVSGIPFGLMGEMLQDGGNLWRGMVYGMTNRMPWGEGDDARPIWKVWDEFGIQGSKMIGYWVKNNPVKTDNPAILATSYVKGKSVLVSVASWAEGDADFHLKIDWKALGINPAKAQIEAPDVKNFQNKSSFTKGQAIPVAKGKGWLIIISEKP